MIIDDGTLGVVGLVGHFLGTCCALHRRSNTEVSWSDLRKKKRIVEPFLRDVSNLIIILDNESWFEQSINQSINRNRVLL